MKAKTVKDKGSIIRYEAMKQVYHKEAQSAIAEPQQIQSLLLASCDLETRALLRLSIDIIVWTCQHTNKPKLTIHCHSKEVTEAIGIRQDYLKRILQEILGCPATIAVYYTIHEGLVYFDTEGAVAPSRWYLCNRKDCGQMKIPLPG